MAAPTTDEQAAITAADQRTSDAEARTREVEAGRLRLEVAEELGLDPALAKRLKGKSKSEMQEDAKTLGAVVETLRPAEEPGDMNARIRRAAGRGISQGNQQATPNADFNAAIRSAAGH